MTCCSLVDFDQEPARAFTVPCYPVSYLLRTLSASLSFSLFSTHTKKKAHTHTRTRTTQKLHAPLFTQPHSARSLAKKKGVNLATVSGTGNFGRVTESDVLAFLGEAPKGAAGGGAATDEGLAMREAPDLPDGPKV